MLALIVEGRVFRYRDPATTHRARKVRWVVHVPTCAYAPGCAPLSDLVDEVGEQGVLGRLRAGVLARCKTCQPVLVAPER